MSDYSLADNGAASGSMLDAIRDALSEFGRVFYGMSQAELSEQWDYIVFRRTELRKNNQVDFARDYTVAIVKENYIPEGYEYEVINAIESATKLRFSQKGAAYSYMFKGNTDLVVEVLTLQFTEHIKRCSLDG